MAPLSSHWGQGYIRNASDKNWSLQSPRRAKKCPALKTTLRSPAQTKSRP
eukprot:CAMPEP_0115541768 /NCGR_PEP_ID=MMETSP0271-20121206/90646_1 /TAXON_ID=71861 /ORGANISM="Scrippsiella trochoidea, Strain CCMP3099" /LENGTH=49 /DNA_ID= /DNA_START= /DNA_END= /DNA_ORIENTATION=